MTGEEGPSVEERAMARAREKADLMAAEMDERARHAAELLPGLEQQYASARDAEATCPDDGAWEDLLRRVEVLGRRLRETYRALGDDRARAEALRREDSSEFSTVLRKEVALARLSGVRTGETARKEPRVWPEDLDEGAGADYCVWRLRNAGWGYQAIADALRDRGVPTARGGKWSSSGVRNIWLREEKAQGSGGA